METTDLTLLQMMNVCIIILETKIRVNPSFWAWIFKIRYTKWLNTEAESTRKKYCKRQGNCFSDAAIDFEQKDV